MEWDRQETEHRTVGALKCAQRGVPGLAGEDASRPPLAGLLDPSQSSAYSF